jgi:hypothetical protein
MKRFFLNHLLILAAGLLVLEAFAGPALAQDVDKIQELQRVIAAQQERLEAQQRQLEAQQKQLDGQRRLMQEFQTQLKSLAEAAEPTAPAPVVAEERKGPEEAPVEKVVTSGEERVKLAISGHVNRAVHIVEDGKNAKAYFVDNDNSESRVRFVGTAKTTDDLTLGGKIELTIAPNKAGEVSQTNEETGNVFDQRWTEVSLDSKRFGKLSLGKGDTASANSAAVDLSRTGVIAYATIADLAGGMLFRQDGDEALTNVRIVDAFNSFDGLSRKNRLRYDTPTFSGFRLATSAISDQRYDASLWWGGQGYGFKAAGAAAFADPNLDDTDFQYDGSFSLLHEDTGLNLTLSAGLLDRDEQDDARNLYGKVGWLNRFFSVGDTAFSVDYTRSTNLPTDSYDGYSVGAAAVQYFEDYGTELYLLYRLHSLDRGADPDVQDINVVSTGARVKF